MRISHHRIIVALALAAGILILSTYFVSTNNSLSEQSNALEAAIVYPSQEYSAHNVFEIPAESVLVASADLEKILYAKNIHQLRPIASITKLMTAMVALDNYNLAHTVTLSSSSVSYLDKDTFQAGETVKVFDLLVALLIESSNEAAYALAESWPHHNGPAYAKQQKFVDAMNKKARELGMARTVFSNPSGLDDGVNASSAWEVALLVRAAHLIPLIRDITVTPRATIYSLQGIAHPLENTNTLLGLLQGIALGKTGMTDEAGQSLTLAIEKDNTPLIVVLLNASDRFLDAKKLIENINP